VAVPFRKRDCELFDDRVWEKTLMRWKYCSALFWVSTYLVRAAHAAPLPPEFTLGQYVPHDVWMYVHVVENPERKWIETRWHEIFQSLKESGIDRDIKGLIFSFLNDEQRSKVQAQIDKTFALLTRVRWADLIRKELVIAERVTPEGVYDYLVLVRGSPGSATGNMQGLRDIIKELATITDKLAVTERKVHDMVSIALGYRESPTEKTQDFATIWQKGDVIAFALIPPGGEGGRLSMSEDVSGLMSGAGDKKALIDAPRFREAVAQVSVPSDTICYFDIHLLMDGMEGMFGSLLQKVDPSDAEERAGLNMMIKLLDTADIVDYSVVSEGTKDRTATTDSCTRLRSGMESTAAAKLFLDRRPFDRFDEYIPANATGFSLSSGIDLERLYNLLVDFVEQNIPKGKVAIEQQLKPALASAGIDLQRDLFSWWSGESISIEMPAAVVTPMGGADWVHMIRVKNAEQASCRVNAGIDYISGLLQTKGQMLQVSPAKCREEGFREVTHPMLAMFIRPVVGVKGEWLIIASSAGAVNKCLDVAAGKAPSIATNERFKREGLIPKGPVQSISFTDTSNFGQELGAAVGMVGMFGGMAVGAMKDQAPPEATQLLQQLMGIVMKLGPVLQKLDFYSSEAHVSVYDGALTYRSQSVVTFLPAPESPANAEAVATKDAAEAAAKASAEKAKAEEKSTDASKPKR